MFHYLKKLFFDYIEREKVIFLRAGSHICFNLRVHLARFLFHNVYLQNKSRVIAVHSNTRLLNTIYYYTQNIPFQMILFFSLYQHINYEIDIKTLHGKFTQARKIVTIGEFDSLMKVVDCVMGDIS